MPPAQRARAASPGRRRSSRAPGRGGQTARSSSRADPQAGLPRAEPDIPAGPPGVRPYRPGVPPSARGAYPPPQTASPGQPALPPETPPGQHSQPRPPSRIAACLPPPASPSQSAPPAAPPVVNPPGVRGEAAARGLAAGDGAAENAAARPAANAAGRGARRPGRCAQGRCPQAEPGKRRPRAGQVPPIRPPRSAAPARRPPRPEQLVWAFPEQPDPEDQAIPFRNAPAVDDAGRMFLQLRDRLVAIEESAGKPKMLWEYVIGKPPRAGRARPEPTLRLHCSDGYLHCLDAATGKQVWSPASVGEPLGYAVPVVDRDGNTWVSSHDGGLAKVDYQGRIQKPARFSVPGRSSTRPPSLPTACCTSARSSATCSPSTSAPSAA